MPLVENLRYITPEKALYRSVGSGATFPFKFATSGRVKSVAVAQGIKKINQSIHTILATRRGERWMVPEFGCVAGDTEILTVAGSRVPIRDLVGAQTVWSFGVAVHSATPYRGEHSTLTPTQTRGAVSRGIKKVVTVLLSDGSKVRCTPDHLWLLSNGKTYCAADQLLPGARLCWVDTTAPEFFLRLSVWKQNRTSAMYTMPVSKGILTVEAVQDNGEFTEVFDLVDSVTQNFSLGCGAVIHNSNLHRLVFEPNDIVLETQLEIETAQALERWERRIKVTNVTIINPNTISNVDLDNMLATSGQLRQLTDGNAVGIYITYLVRQMNMQGSYVYPFSRQAMPMSETVTKGGFWGVESLYGQGLSGPQQGVR